MSEPIARGVSRGLALLAALVAGTGVAEAQAPLNLLTYGNIFKDNYERVVTQPFTAAGGARVQFHDVGTTGSAGMLGSLRAQRADPQLDVVIMDTTTAAQACAEGLVEKISPADFPVLAELDAQAREAAGGCGPAVTYDHLVLIYDTRAVPQAPAGFSALWDPQWRGKISVSAPPNIQGLALTAILAHQATGNWRNIAAVMPRLRELAPAVQTFDPSPDGYTLILNNQVAFGTGWNARAQLYRDQSAGRIGVVLPAEGTVFQINTINIVAGSKNRAAAVAFFNHALSAPAQTAFTEAMFYGPTNSRAQVKPEAMARTALAPQFRDRVIPLDWTEMQRMREQWNQRWRREIIAASQR